MKFKELMEKYKNKTATPEETLQVEEEIEKFEEIESYLDDNLRGSLHDMKEDEEEKDAGSRTGDFTDAVQKAVRRSLRKTGLITGSILLAIVLFLVFGLSPLMNAIYYNPTKIKIGSAGGNTSVTNFELDMKIYSELHLPFANMRVDNVIPLGYGNYNIRILKAERRAMTTTHELISAGMINKGKLQLYSPNILSEVYNTRNIYLKGSQSLDPFSQYGQNNMSPFYEGFTSLQGDLLSQSGLFGKQPLFVEDDDGRLQIVEYHDVGLQDYVKVEIGFNKTLTFEEYLKFKKEIPGEILSFYTEVGEQGILNVGNRNRERESLSKEDSDLWTREMDERYPLLIDSIYDLDTCLSGDGGMDIVKMTIDGEKRYDVSSEEDTMLHFKSMLRYMVENEKFAKLMGRDVKFYEDALMYVEKNGFEIRGIVVEIWDEDVLLRLMQNELVEWIAISE